LEESMRQGRGGGKERGKGKKGELCAGQKWRELRRRRGEKRAEESDWGRNPFK